MTLSVTNPYGFEKDVEGRNGNLSKKENYRD
jgi:hypothetical protein